MTRVVRRVCVLPCTDLAAAALLRRVPGGLLGAFVDVQTYRGAVGALDRRLLWLLPGAQDLLRPHSPVLVQIILDLRSPVVLVVPKAAVI